MWNNFIGLGNCAGLFYFGKLVMNGFSPCNLTTYYSIGFVCPLDGSQLFKTDGSFVYKFCTRRDALKFRKPSLMHFFTDSIPFFRITLLTWYSIWTRQLGNNISSQSKCRRRKVPKL
jgi:hypothetical protein